MESSSENNFVNRLRFDRIMVTNLWPCFWPTLYDQVISLTLNPIAPIKGMSPKFYHLIIGEIYTVPENFVKIVEWFVRGFIFR